MITSPYRRFDQQTSGHSLSPQQEDVRKWVKESTGSAFVEAVAGSGKTTTLIAACAEMEGDVAFAAFNKKIADEIKSKVRDYRNVRPGTFHSFGFRSWINAAPDVICKPSEKTRAMLRANRVSTGLGSAVSSLVSIAKQSMIGKLWQLDDYVYWSAIVDHFDIMIRVRNRDPHDENTRNEIIESAMKCVTWSREMGDRIVDFDDMLWLPLVNDVHVSQHDWVLVDEAQDTNAARRLLAARMLREGGRSIWVGDRHQAIYGFTGADSDAVDRIVQEFDCKLLPLTVTFRCSKKPTELAQTYVPEIEAHEDNLEGVVYHDTRADFWRSAHELRAGDAILCRNNLPLIETAFKLIQMGVGCHVEGRNIGEDLENLATRWGEDNAAVITERIIDYRRFETIRLAKEDNLGAIARLNDRVDSILCIMDGCVTVRDIQSKISTLFRDSNDGGSSTVVLSTVHKAKGREWDRVFVIGWGELMPSKWARQAWELEQEKNIIYVAITRTKDELILLPELRVVR